MLIFPTHKKNIILTKVQRCKVCRTSRIPNWSRRSYTFSIESCWKQNSVCFQAFQACQETVHAKSCQFNWSIVDNTYFDLKNRFRKMVKWAYFPKYNTINYTKTLRKLRSTIIRGFSWLKYRWMFLLKMKLLNFSTMYSPSLFIIFQRIDVIILDTSRMEVLRFSFALPDVNFNNKQFTSG